MINPTFNPLSTFSEHCSPSLFPAELPVSYDAAGHVVSRFGDPIWDFSSMSVDGTSAKSLRFYEAEIVSTSGPGNLIREQQKALIWLHIDGGRTRAFLTLLHANMALGVWCKLAADRRVDLYTLLTNQEWVAQGALHLNKNYLNCTSSLLKTLWRHRQRLGAPEAIQLQKLRDVLNIEARSRPESQQTPLIPSRVYCAILAALDIRMSALEDELDTLLTAYQAIFRARLDGSNVAQRKAEIANVAEQMKVLGYVPAPARALYSFVQSRLVEHQVALILVVAAFTGMRISEVSELPLEGVLAEFEHVGTVHYEVHGSTRKLHKGVKRSTTWITSYQGARAVGLAQRIARVVDQVHGKPPNAGQRALLFPSTMNPYKRMAQSGLDRSLTSLRGVLCPVVQQCDIEELDRLEMARGWARDDIVVGKRWPLTLHQLRRSLAVYAHRSGMVSLPGLKAQLQHITDEMAAYYSGGFSRAVNLVFDKQHFSHEWQAALGESSYFAYAFGVLFSDDALLMQGAQRMATTVQSRSRKDTLRLFQENKLAYRETPLGGCVSTEDCKTDPLEPIPYDCLETNCVNQVIYGKRLNHLINYQRAAVAKLANDEAGSVEHRLEAKHLEVLVRARNRLSNGVR